MRNPYLFENAAPSSPTWNDTNVVCCAEQLDLKERMLKLEIHWTKGRTHLKGVFKSCKFCGCRSSI